MKSIFIIYLILFSYTSFSQENIQIRSEYSNIPIPYAKIIIKQDNNFVDVLYSDSLGFFNKKGIMGTLEIEAFNFESKKISISKIQDVIYLHESVNELPDLIINLSKKQKFLGDIDAKGKNIPISLIEKGTELVMLFKKEITDEYNLLKSINFFTNKKNKGHKYLARIVVYKNENEQPTNIIYQSKPIELQYDKDGKNTIIFEKEVIIPSEGLFVGIEYLGVISLSEKKNIEPGFKWKNYKENKKVFVKKNNLTHWVSCNEILGDFFIEKGLNNLYPIFYIELEKN